MHRGVLGAVLAVVTAAAAQAAPSATAASRCVQPQGSPAYAASVRHALAAGRDVWGDELLRSREGPTYAGAARHLRPLLLAGARGRRGSLTRSGVYYLPFGRPAGGFGTRTVALHVADGSELLADRTDGPRLDISVGSRGSPERYGACLSRLSTPALYRGYLPALETRYVDAGGARYRQESFAARVPTTRSLVSFVRLAVDARRARRAVRVEFTPSVRHLRRTPEGSLVRGRHTYLYLGAGARYDGSTVAYDVPAHRRAVVYVGWFVDPHKSDAFTLDEAAYRRARRGLVTFWSGWLQQAARFEVPEARVDDAARSLLIQNSVLSWRYSIGNSYQELSVPEVSDVAQVMGDYGFRKIDEAILRTWFWRDLAETANWAIGEQLLASARYYRLFHDRGFVAAHTPALESYLDRLGAQLDGGERGLLQRERYSADVGESVLGLHSQAVVWQGLRAMGSVWARTGRPELGQRARALAARLGGGLRRAVRQSQRRLPDGSLFLPVRLLDREGPYRDLTASRAGSYWNLVMPYALASGLFAANGPQARGVVRYLLGHGSRLLGLVRAGAYSLYGRPRFPTSGTDQVYGLNVARFLAAQDRPDQLVLGLYGQLAAGMTRGTYVSGEGATVAPVPGEYYRKMFLPPNAGSNATFLETLRLMLVHETADGLELAFATPRAWLRPGRRIVVRGAPTSFGRVGYSVAAGDGVVRVVVRAPAARALRTLRLRLRLPAGGRLTRVVLDGRHYGRFDPATGTIDLSGRRGRLTVEAMYTPARTP